MATNLTHPDFEAIKVLLDEWKWRHQHCWKSLQRFGLTGVAIAAVPYAKAEVLEHSLGAGTLIFPVAAWIFALAAAWLYTAEYTRCRPVETKYYDLLGERLRPIKIYGQIGTKRGSIGRATISIFIVGSTVVSVANAVILMKVANVTSISWQSFRRGAVATIILSFAIAWFTQWWAARQIRYLVTGQIDEGRKG